MKTLPPGSIDGSVHPELIPDAVAYRLFFSSPYQSGVSSNSLSARQRAKLAPAHLSESEQLAVVAAAGTLKSLLIENSQTNTVSDSAINDLAQQLARSLADKMTSDSFQRLKAHIQAEKIHMVIFPLPSMSSMGH